MLQTGSVTDAHSLVAGAPVTDECTQDWTLLSADIDGESLVFEAERALDTGDAQDRVFVDDTADGEDWLDCFVSHGSSSKSSHCTFCLGAQTVELVWFSRLKFAVVLLRCFPCKRGGEDACLLPRLAYGWGSRCAHQQPLDTIGIVFN